jgi:hypothetical protein
LDASKRSRSSLQIRDAVDFESFSSPAAASHLSRRFVLNFYLGQRPAPAAGTP